MAVVGFYCEKTDQQMPFEECLECARSRLNRKLDCPFDEAVIAGMIDNIKNKVGISVTMISGCHRAAFIQQHHDTWVYPSGMYWAFRGQIAHKVMEEAALHDDAVIETRFEKEWDGILVEGTPDLIVPSQRVLKDYKTTVSIPSYLNKDRRILAYDNHRVQVNLYAWLVPHDIEELEVVYMSMEETRICPVEVWAETSTKKTYMTVDRYMEENLVPLYEALESETMPPYARTWACDEYCGVSDICYRELKKGLMAARRVVPLKKKGKKNGKAATAKATG